MQEQSYGRYFSDIKRGTGGKGVTVKSLMNWKTLAIVLYAKKL